MRTIISTCADLCLSLYYLCHPIIPPVEIMATSSKPAKEICASCGKIGGENGFKLKKCSGCHLVNYCGIECQGVHRPSHKTTCQNHAIHQEAERVADVLGQHEKMNPPETEDCPICLQPIRVVDVNVRHFACCGKFDLIHVLYAGPLQLWVSKSKRS